MLKPKLAKKVCALGLLAVLYGSNLAYANGNTNPPLVTKPARGRTETASADRSSTPTTSSADKTTVVTKEKKEMTLKALSKAEKSCACSCASVKGRAAAAASPFWDCLRGCLRSWGVSIVQILLCGGSCAFGMVPVCALCLGIDVSLVMLCAMGCDVYGPGTENPHNPRNPVLVRKNPNKRMAERRALAFVARR